MAALFSKPKMPEIKPPAPMPDEQDPAVRAAGRRRVGQMMQRGGRRSTILSEGFGPRGDQFDRERMG